MANDDINSRSRSLATFPGLSSAMGYTRFASGACWLSSPSSAAHHGRPVRTRLAITGPVFVFAGFNLRTVQVTDARRDFQFGDYLGLRLLSIAAGIAVVFAIEIISRHDADLLLVVLMTAAAKSLDLIGDTASSASSSSTNAWTASPCPRCSGARSSFSPVAAAAYLTRNVLWAVTGQAAVSLAVLITYDLRNAGRLHHIPLAHAESGPLPRAGSPRHACASAPGATSARSSDCPFHSASWPCSARLW